MRRELRPLTRNGLLRHVNLNRIFIKTLAARNKSDNATNVAADVIEIIYRKTVLEKSSNELLFTHMHDMKKIPIALFEIVIRAGGGTVESIL